MARKQVPVCTVDGCEAKTLARDLCGLHYRRLSAYGDVRADVPPQGRAGAPNRPRKGDLILCVECQQWFPAEAFAARRSRCHPCHKVHARRQYDAARGECVDCGASASRGHQRCRGCAALANRKAPAPHRRMFNGDGYVLLLGYHDHPNAHAQRGAILEHVKVMSDMLGRALLPGENVHHINGVRDDNRPENLELWSTSQPSGQRVADKVQWAKDLLALYEPDALAVPQLRFVEDLAS